MTYSVSPPKPIIALRVGVTGHRQSRLASDQIARINGQVDAVLDIVAAGVARTAAKYQAEYAEAPAKLYFVSALADGADTLAAKRALKKNWRLLAPLPFSKEAYAADFSAEDRRELDALLAHADAVTELDGLRDNPALEEKAYLQAGVMTIMQSDFVIAIWDGEEARGVGGTAMIKEEALAVGKLVVWINAAADKEPVFLRADGTEASFDADAVYAAVDAVAAPPPEAEIEHAFSGKKTHARAAYRDYAEEDSHTFNYGSFFQFWERVFAGRWPFAVRLFSPSPETEIAHARKTTLADKVEATLHDREVFDELIIPRFVWADHLAIHYGNLYRSSYFFNYLFAAIAVFLALFHLVADGFGFGSKTIWITTEVVLIIMILGVTTAGKRGRWHEKWIDYRQLAEEMRQYRLYFLTLGRKTGVDDFTQGEGGEAAGWVDWYFAATRREAGMTSGSFDAANICVIAETVLREEIRPQIAYHDRKAATLHVMEHRLHILGEMAFATTLLICLGYLFLVFYGDKDGGAAQAFTYKAEKIAKNWVTMMTGFLPALGAAFFGIRVQGEFGSTAERSHATATQLKNIAEKFEALAEADAPRLRNLRVRVEEAAQAMLMENMDWRLLYISKPLNLPG